MGDARRDLRTALNRLTAAYRDAAEAVAAHEPHVSFDAATELAGELKRLSGAVARLRAQRARQMRRAEQLSLAQLARRLDVSKTRAHQLIQMAGEQVVDGGDHRNQPDDTSIERTAR